MFQFKQFSVLQERSAMKVGTDAVLLGSWAPVGKAKNILDIGTGTGLIALMLAQRNATAKVHAVEIEENACLEASINFKKAPWSDRLKVYNDSLQHFETIIKYDLIVSNPPYYQDTFKGLNSNRTLARHVDNLSFQDLLFYTSSMLHDEGTCAFIIPFSEEDYFIKLAKKNGLNICKLTRVRGRVDLPFKRSLLCLKKKFCDCEETELVIEVKRHVYTSDYIELTKSFYLKM